MSTGRHIAFICHPYHRGGVTRWMADAAGAFADKGWCVFFVTVTPEKPFFSGGARETMTELVQKQNSNIRLISEPAGYEFELGSPAYRSWIYARLLRRLPAGTPLILSDNDTIWDTAAALHETCPMIGVLHADDPYYYALAEKYHAQAAALVCVSNRIADTLKKKLPQFPQSSCYTIPCGINLPPAITDQGAHKEIQLVYTGRITEFQKRVGDLVLISKGLRKNNVFFHLHIIGDGTDRALLENKFTDAGLNDCVTFHGWLAQQQVYEYLAAADILILTSDFEGTPIAMMEALASGCGVVGTQVSGIEDYERRPLAANCFATYTAGDTEQAVAQIIRIAGIPAGTRSADARRLAVAEFSMDVCISRYSTVIGQIKTDHCKPAAAVKMSLTDMLSSRAIALARYLKLRFGA